jgi:hypothetical protein
MPERTFSRPESVRAFYSGRLELGQFNIDALKQYVCTVTHIELPKHLQAVFDPYFQSFQ